MIFNCTVHAAEKEHEVRLIYLCNSTNQFADDTETRNAFLEFLRHERTMLKDRGQVVLIGMEETADWKMIPAIDTLVAATGMQGIFVNQEKVVPKKPKKVKGKKKSRQETDNAVPSGLLFFKNSPSALILDEGSIRLSFGKSEERTYQTVIRFNFFSAIPSIGSRQYFFINQPSLPQFGIMNDSYYLNCHMNYGSAGRLKLFFRKNQLIRQNADTVQVNRQNTSNSWYIP